MSDDETTLRDCPDYDAFCAERSASSATAHAAMVEEFSVLVMSYRGSVKSRSPDHIRMDGRRIRSRLATFGAERELIAREAVIASGGSDADVAAFLLEFAS